MQAYDKNIPIPTYEYYAKNPLSVYDYAQNYYRSHIDTTPVIIRIIQQVLEKALGLQIDHYLIPDSRKRDDEFSPRLAEPPGFY